MNIILLSGGVGKRLWPLSNNCKPKQFHKIMEMSDGTKESMIQRTYRMLQSIDDSVRITVSASIGQENLIREQLDCNTDICIEPSERSTLGSIILSVAYLHDIKGVGNEEVVLVCPVDSFFDTEYCSALLKLMK